MITVAAGHRYDIDDLRDPYNQYFVNQGLMDNEIRGISTTLTYSLDNVSFEYNGSYREYDFHHRNAAREWQIGMDYPGARDEAEAVILNNEQTATEEIDSDDIIDLEDFLCSVNVEGENMMDVTPAP